MVYIEVYNGFVLLVNNLFYGLGFQLIICFVLASVNIVQVNITSETELAEKTF